MSKIDLQLSAQKHSGGVSYQDSLRASMMEPSMYERIGKEEGFRKLSELFYERVFNDPSPWFLSIFSSSTKAEAIDNQVGKVYRTVYRLS
mmetsp:Transcript_24603/g.44522  ORF Transcript_24603/g.44522 Transcript_24603/m.44522 type:complete len:90 (-) Transcript_24603:81-350(-)